MELRKVIRERRSVRKFLDRQVPEEKLIKLIESAQWAPSACNKQMWEFVIVRSPSVKERLVKEGGAMPLVAKAPASIYVLYRSDVTAESYANIQSASAAVQNMLLTAHDMGLGAVWVADCGNREKVRKILSIPQRFLVMAAVLVGYPDHVPGAPERRSIEEIVHFDAFSGTAEKHDKIFPEGWSEKSLIDYRSRGIRATSPSKDAFLPGFMGEFKKSVEIVSSLMPDNGKVLDVLPFGGAHLMGVMHNTGREMYAYEVSKDISDFLKGRKELSGIKERLTVKEGGLYKIPYNEGEFSLVTCINKLEIMPEPSRLLVEIARVTKRGGRLVLSFWNSRSIYGLNYRLKTGIMGKYDVTSNEGPVRPMGYGKVRLMLSSVGFSVVERRGVNLAPLLGLDMFETMGQLKSLCRINILLCEKTD
jgi:nitroreductase